MIADDTIKELLDAVDIESFLDREGIDYRSTQGSRGPQFNVRECPVCGAGNWKVYLNQDTGLGNCFGGDHPPGKNFNKWSFIAASLNLNGGQMVNYLTQFAKQQGWKPPRMNLVATEVTPQEWKLPQSHELPIMGRNLKYLANRNIPVEMGRYFRLRFCNKGHFAYKLAGDWKFQIYNDRIIIPIYDLAGKLVTFQGRDITGTQDPKYLFPPGLASSGTHLYNGFNVHDTKRVAIGEGAFDVIALKMALDGDPALRDVVPVGTFGKHLSFGEDNSQVGKLMELKQRGVQELTFMWDGELKATDEAVTKGAMLKGLGFTVRIAMLSHGKDPNEMTGEEVRAAFYQAIPLTVTSASQIRMLARKRELSHP
jgi:DNA primase